MFLSALINWNNGVISLPISTSVIVSIGTLLTTISAVLVANVRSANQLHG